MNDFIFQTRKKTQHPFVNVSFPVNFKPFKLFGWDRRCALENRTQKIELRVETRWAWESGSLRQVGSAKNIFEMS